MHVSHCVSHPERNCRQGGPTSCRRCPFARMMNRTPEEKLESLVASWTRAVGNNSGRLNTCPAEFMGMPLRAAVVERLTPVA